MPAFAHAMRVFADLWDVERFFDCDCSPLRAARLGHMNRTQRHDAVRVVRVLGASPIIRAAEQLSEDASSAAGDESPPVDEPSEAAFGPRS